VLPHACDCAVVEHDRRDPAGDAIDAVVGTRRQERLARPVVERVEVEVRQQVDRLRRVERVEQLRVPGDHPGHAALGLDGLQLVPEGLTDSARRRRVAAPPAREVLVGRRPVRADVAEEDLPQRLVGVGPLEPAEPALGVDERDVAATVRPEDEGALVGDGLEERAPAAEELVGEVLGRGGGELLAGLARAVERCPDPGDQRVHLLERHAEVPQPGLPSPLRAAGERRRPEPEVPRGQQMKRPAHAPGLDELPPLP
jgi:hypothetical protein